MFTLTRPEHNPILSPVEEHPWEAVATFNGCPIIHKNKIHLLYRAMSEPDPIKESHISMSVIGSATSKDGKSFGDRKILISPDRDFDQYGCEDPRVTKMGSKYYIFYTALGGFPFSKDNIKVAVAISKDLETIEEKHLVTPFNAKAMTLFPDKINDKFGALITINTDPGPSDICYAEFDKLEDMWSKDYWDNWWKDIDAHKINFRRLPTDQLEVGAPPIKTSEGWLVVYAHIQKYWSDDKVFGIETVLLNLRNPRLINGRTKGPFMVPDVYYEQAGHTSHTIFPSGALIRKKKLEIYYGASDTHCAVATIPADNLIKYMAEQGKLDIKRFPGNPIIIPRPGLSWEEKGTFNPTAIDLGGKIHILYRAVSDKNVSTIGYAISKDGFSIDERLEKPIYVPRAEFEKRGDAEDNFGCEDARINKIGETLYITYTAYNGSLPRVAVSSISVKNFLAHKWETWTFPIVITPEGITDKDAAIFPEKFKGKYLVLHRINESVCADYVTSLDFSKNQLDNCIEIIGPHPGMWDNSKVGISTPPIKTRAGWLLLYHGISWNATYRVGVLLLDLKDPTIIRSRMAVPLLEPEQEYERKGAVHNVVFPCGIVVRKGLAYIYYGGADSVTAVATVKIATLLKMLKV